MKKECKRKNGDNN